MYRAECAQRAAAAAQRAKEDASRLAQGVPVLDRDYRFTRLHEPIGPMLPLTQRNDPKVYVDPTASSMTAGTAAELYAAQQQEMARARGRAERDHGATREARGDAAMLRARVRNAEKQWKGELEQVGID